MANRVRSLDAQIPLHRERAVRTLDNKFVDTFATQIGLLRMQVPENTVLSRFNTPRVILRHTLSVRLWHWINVLAMGLLLMSGLYIFNMHPHLYWGEDGHEGLPTLLSVRVQNPGTPEQTSTLQVGALVVPTTGILGHMTRDPEEPHDIAPLAFPTAVVFPASAGLGDARAWHFFMAWVLALAYFAYMVHGLMSGHYWRDFVPNRDQLKPRAILNDLWLHLRFRRIRGNASSVYNLLQRLAYGAVVFVLIPVQIISGLLISSSFGAIFPQFYDLIGGRQSARTIHFTIAMLLVLFLLLHVVQVVVAGVRNEIRSMITGRFVVEPEEPAE